MEITSYLQDNTLTVFLKGEVDFQCTKEVITTITNELEKTTPKICQLDFKDVSFMDESGIAVVINILRQMTILNGTLSVCGVCKQPMNVFRASGVDKLVHIEPLKK